MKYLFKHKKEFILTIIMFIMIIYILYDGIKSGAPVQSVIETVITLLVWYFNMPTSIGGDITKIELKQINACRNVGYEGAPEPEDASIDEVEE